ncbi:MAG: hypothetical protein CM1200mP14_23420 [Gammaproteobacteria bacterium]|nr:MAG: hypothetical protein CM1200mP14_23420 [Gammaproteobacteria bacterium]
MGRPRGVTTRSCGSPFRRRKDSGRLPIPLPPAHRIGEGLDRPKVTARVITRAGDDPLVAAGIVDVVRVFGPLWAGANTS